MTFSFTQVHHQMDQNVKCIIIMRIEAISFQIYNIHREIIENNFPFPPEFGRPNWHPFFVIGASQDALLAKSLLQIEQIPKPMDAHYCVKKKHVIFHDIIT